MLRKLDRSFFGNLRFINFTPSPLVPMHVILLITKHVEIRHLAGNLLKRLELR